MDTFNSFEVIRSILQNAVLSPNERRKLKEELNLNQEGGKGTTWLSSWEEYQKIAKELKGQLLSPGGAAGFLGVSRARIHQLEKEGKVRAYRIKAEGLSDEDFKRDLEIVPFWYRPFIKKPKPSSFIYIPREDLKDYKNIKRRKNKVQA